MSPSASDPAPSFDDTVERLRILRESDDGSRWTAGDVVVAYLGTSEHSDAETVLNKLAAHSGYERGGLRERYHCSLFWPEAARLWDITVTWSHYNRARRGVEFEQACDFVAWAEKRAASVARFERALKRWKRLKGLLEKVEPADLRKQAVAAVKKYYGAETDMGWKIAAGMALEWLKGDAPRPADDPDRLEALAAAGADVYDETAPLVEAEMEI